MPSGNRFRHQEYLLGPVRDGIEWTRAEAGPPVDSDAGRERMRAVGESLKAAGVSAIYLVHGTFVGGDLLGVLGDLARVAPSTAARLRSLQKRTVDRLTGEAGNYTEGYARAFEESTGLPVRLFHWSSENHHIGRADAAVRLLDEIAGLELPAGGRVLCWAHSHGGNALALATNLLGGDFPSSGRFFRAARSFYRWPIFRKLDLAVWARVKRRLKRTETPWSGLNLDVVTFGTPVRYGWETDGYDRLLHIVNHEPAPGLPRHQALFPPDRAKMLEGAGGDHVQQMGIAGTNLPPNLFAFRTWLADRRLNRFLQPGLRARDLFVRLKVGVRAPDEGSTLLVDYGERGGSVLDHAAGHAVYTKLAWLPFHAEQVARLLYSSSASST